VSLRRGFRAVLVGAITFIVALICVPQCGVQIYADNASWISLGFGAVMTFLAYRVE